MKTYAPHEQRVIDEKQQLDTKLAALTDFIADKNGMFSKLAVTERVRLRAQRWVMKDYSDILGARITAFGEPNFSAPEETKPQSFGEALEAMESGRRIARQGWDGKNMFVYLVPANSYPAQTGVAKAHFGENAMVPYNAYMALKGVDGTVSTWVPSSSDALAKDWVVLGGA